MKESLRLHPPIHTVMRKVEKDLEYGQYTIPTGHLLCASQGVTHMDDKRFPDPNTFNPSRFLNVSDGNDEWTINGVNIAQKSARSHFLPFGAVSLSHLGPPSLYRRSVWISPSQDDHLEIHPHL